ncbi:insulinase family protein [Alteromonas aestuariivivens]|uniref:Insulinase family protein n=1 Tax=Alteromonas aestuariivivens TaxID=1938339 RepID=A0A3D8M6H9_9ALTE|nr:pitrilysin family protein [Alteromonas aestuariivivens]RDV25155.1 insulinase family protein [Alteromonas aestuariivivens]
MSASLTFRKYLLASAIMLLAACQQQPGEVASPQDSAGGIHIPYQRYTLENGLTVILHKDQSDPLVHVDVTYHVGSAREEVGKSGFAHFFEHMMFQGSKNVADEQHFKVITEAGGELNGSTNTDRTNYYQTVPANQLEKVLWLEADRMGFLLDAVDQEKFENQRETVKNERAQRIDNQPYGLRDERTSEALYPQGHPYSWSTIGYVEDLDRVNVNDLKAFFKRWYGPNNAVLTIGGDIDIAKTKAWVERYFGSLPTGPAVDEPAPMPVTLAENRYLTLEDKVHLPLLQITFPTVYARHPDEAPLDVLADILGGGKTSLFYKNLVKGGSAVQAVVSHPCRELACEFRLLALANPAKVTNLAELNQTVEQTLSEFEARGVLPDDLARTKGQIEASTVFGLQSVAGKVSTLAANQTFDGQPDLVAEDIARYKAVTAEDVMRVYRQYIKGRNAVILSVVPQGQASMAVRQQNFAMPARQIPAESGSVSYSEEVASVVDSFDRSKLPEAGPAPIVEVPQYWKSEVEPGIKLLGVTSDETPTVTLTLSMEGGVLLDPPGKAGTAYLTAMMMNEATQNFTNEQMANELAKLGSTISFNAAGRYSQVYVSSLTQHFPETLNLLQEKLFSPAFEEQDFKRLKERLKQSMQQQLNSPGYLAKRARDWVLFGEQNRVSQPDEGTLQSLDNIELADIKAFYQRYYVPAKANIVVVSDLSQQQVQRGLAFLSSWQGKDYDFPEYEGFPEYQQTSLYLVDNPGAVQSVVYIVKRGLPFDATGTFFRSQLMNFPLGGAFNSRINLNLREDKGYTYGASSNFMGGKTLGWFEVNADLNGPNTADGIKEIFSEITRYKEQGVSEQEVSFMRNAYTLSDALEYETPTSKARFLRQLLSYQLSDDYRARQIQIIHQIGADELTALARQQLDTGQMQIIVAGDKQQLMEQLVTLEVPIFELDVQTNVTTPLN